MRIALVVPEPRNNDAFWSQWRDHQRSDMMPDVTQGTPVFVAGTVSVLVNVDPRRLDLETPAKLVLSGQDGTRIYRSSTVVPAHGDNWDQRGVRWLFTSDADLYRTLRDGADTTVSIRYRGRDQDHDIRIPFATADFANSARSFEADLRQRMPQIANNWERNRPEAGTGYPPPPYGTNGDNGWRKQNAQVMAYRPPADNCGPQPQPVTANPNDYMGYSQVDLDRAQASLWQLKAWLDCRQQWLGQYQNSVNVLDHKMAQPGQPPSQATHNAQGGAAVLAQLDNARQRQSETQRLLTTHIAKLNEARKIASATAQQPTRSAPPKPVTIPAPPANPPQSPMHKPQATETPPATPIKPPPAAPSATQNKPAATAQQQTTTQPPLHKPQTAETLPAGPVKPPPPAPAAAQNKPAATVQQQIAIQSPWHKPQTAETPPANPVKPPLSVSTQPNTQQIVLNFRAPDDTCGSEPSFASSDPAAYQSASPADIKAATVAIVKVETWVGCRQQWLAKYQTAINQLGRKIGSDSDPQHAVMGAPGGAQIIANYNDAKRHTEEKRAELQRQAAALIQVRGAMRKSETVRNGPAAQKNGGKPNPP
ncbi:MAG TPA: hypothetical protein VGT78_11355 [Rhizomicrobium sp.]|nr:hypothetical protein [Rhizomicrobium sp.]